MFTSSAWSFALLCSAPAPLAPGKAKQSKARSKAREHFHPSNLSHAQFRDQCRSNERCQTPHATRMDWHTMASISAVATDRCLPRLHRHSMLTTPVPDEQPRSKAASVWDCFKHSH